MPLILAIEPDRRQASQLTALVRGRLHAELVLGDSADRALAALGERVPDLVLTAALLSPKDEAALGHRLRELNGVAAHVQTLTIPVLASGKASKHGLRGGGLLSALRRDKPNDSAPEGCDPAIFAEQCKEYLERAATERDDADRDHDDAPAVETASAITTTFADAAAAPAHDPAVDAAFFEPAVEASAIQEPIVQAVAAPPPVQQVVVRETVAPPVVRAERKRERVTLDDPLGLSDGPASLVAALALFEADEEATREAPVRAHEKTETAAAADEMDLSSLLEAAIDRPRQASRHVDEEPAVDVYELDDALLQPGIDPLAAAAREGAPAPNAGSADEAEHPQEWLDIIEALRRDAEQMPIRKPRAETAPPPAPLSEPVAAATAGDSVAKRKRTSGTPAQDEWGFFDPDQCGFAALLEKLQEITDQDESHTPSHAPSA
jgi:hypothetical protein